MDPKERKEKGRRLASILKRWGAGLIVPFLLLLLWGLAGARGWVSPLFLPELHVVAATFKRMLVDGSLLQHLGASAYRLVVGFSLALVTAVPAGVLMGQVQLICRFLTPILTFLQQIPPIAWIPMFILWMGIGEEPKIAVILYSAFFPIFLNTVQGVTNVDPRLREAAYAFKLSPWQMICRVHIPSAVGPLFVGFRLGLSNGWRALVGAELIAASSGIGSLITEGRRLVQPDKIFVAILTIGVAGAFIDILLRRLEKRLVPWQSGGDP